MKHKVLSLLQPWASLCPTGEKRIETRSWNTKYRGPLLIHASAGKKPLCRSLTLDFHQQFYPLNLPRYIDLPFGAIIGSVNLVDTFSTNVLFSKQLSVDPKNHFFEKNGHLWELTEQEKAFGDYSPDRYGWLLSDPILFKEPIPAKGKLSIWEWEGDIVNQKSIEITLGEIIKK